MLASKRQELILAEVNRAGQVTVAKLSGSMGVSSETIRRDIQYLDGLRQLRRVHGGAVAVLGNRQENAYQQRREENLVEKQAIGACAASFVQENDVIGIDSGATLDWLCRALPPVKNLTIITSSVSALEILTERVRAGEISPRVIFLGGEVNFSSFYTQGSMTLSALRQFSMDKCFLAATAVSADGVKMYDMFDGAYSGVLLERSAKVFYLGASEKAGREALYKVCDLKALHQYITDDRFPMPPLLKKALDACHVQCHLVSGDWGQAAE